MDEKEKIQLVLKVIKKLNEINHRTGETFIQKIIYFLIHSENVPIDYEYTLYDYGPYSFELNNELSQMEMSRMIIKHPDPSGYGFEIKPNMKMKSVKSLLEKGTKYDAKINSLITNFKGMPAKHLGLVATFRYMHEQLKQKGINDDRILINKVSDIKPMFNDFELKKLLKKYESLIKQ